jgi:LysM repeat protein
MAMLRDGGGALDPPAPLLKRAREGHEAPRHEAAAGAPPAPLPAQAADAASLVVAANGDASAEDWRAVAAVLSGDRFRLRQEEQLRCCGAALGALDGRARAVMHRMYCDSVLRELAASVDEPRLGRVFAAVTGGCAAPAALLSEEEHARLRRCVATLQDMGAWMAIAGLASAEEHAPRRAAVGSISRGEVGGLDSDASDARSNRSEPASFPPSPPLSSIDGAWQAGGDRVERLADELDGLLSLSDCTAEHTVGVGETLATIAMRYGLDRRQLRAWNALLSDSPMVGQRLRLEPPESASLGILFAFQPRQSRRQPHRAPPPTQPCDVTGQSARLFVTRRALANPWKASQVSQMRGGLGPSCIPAG